MSRKHPNNIPIMGYKPKALGNTATQIIDDAIMANQMCLNELTKILNNQLTTEGVLRAIGLAIAESSKVQGSLNKVRYLGK